MMTLFKCSQYVELYFIGPPSEFDGILLEKYSWTIQLSFSPDEQANNQAWKHAWNFMCIAKMNILGSALFLS